jgi:C-terminal processing protease CtpA/Prc
VLTTDGNEYYPTIVDLTDDSTVKAAGAERHDVILGIDGQSLCNVPLVDFISAIQARRGKSATFALRRLKKTLTIQMEL